MLRLQRSIEFTWKIQHEREIEKSRLQRRSVFEKNFFKLLAFIINSCNYDCEYCYNDLPRTNEKIDLEKLRFFVENVLMEKLGKRYVQLELIGGEPTLHPDLPKFVAEISKMENVYTTIYSNFSKPVEYYRKLLETDGRISLILSRHSANARFVEKLGLFSKEELEKT